jgi:hypothetical protein
VNVGGALMRKLERHGDGLNRSRQCRLCGGRRDPRRVGKPGDPDYAVMVCPCCDTLRGDVHPPDLAPPVCA